MTSVFCSDSLRGAAVEHTPRGARLDGPQPRRLMGRARLQGRVNLDTVLGGVHSRPPASTPSDADGPSEGQLRDISREVCMVEGKGFEPSTSALRTPRSPN